MIMFSVNLVELAKNFQISMYNFVKEKENSLELLESVNKSYMQPSCSAKAQSPISK